MNCRSEFDRAAWETWLLTLPQERAAGLREGMALAEWFDLEFEKIKEREDDERNAG